MITDIRSVFRVLIRRRIFAATTVLTLALGIGAATAIFSVVDKIIFRTDEFPSDVYLIGGQNDNIPFMPWRYPYMVQPYGSQTDVIGPIAKASIMTGNVVVNNQPVAIGWNGVSSDFFDLLNIHTALGRKFLPGEDLEGAAAVAIVTHGFWVRQLGARSDAIGSTIVVGDARCTVVGVLREGEDLLPFTPNEVFRPLVYKNDPSQPWSPYLYLLCQLRPGITRNQAELRLREVQIDVPAPARQFYFNDRSVLKSLPEIKQQARPEIYWMMLAAVAFLYIISCLNASNLMLIRVLSQQREFGIRLSLGGGYWRTIRLVVIESFTLALFASLGGAILASWIHPLLLTGARGANIAPNWTGWALDWRALGIVGALTMATSILVVLVPTVQIVRSNVGLTLKQGGAVLGQSSDASRILRSLIVFQVAFAIVLLTGTGLMIRSIHRLESTDAGFDATGRMKVKLGFPPAFPSQVDARLAKLHEIQAELMSIPDVRAVGFGMDIFLPGYYYPTYVLEGADGRTLKAAMLGFGTGYQDASGLILKSGHWLTNRSGNEILVNETLARQCWQNGSAVGNVLRPIKEGNDPSGWKGWVVAGVVGDIKTSVRDAPNPYMYGPERWGPEDFDTFIVRTDAGKEDSLGYLIRNKLYAYDPEIVVDSVVPFNQLRKNQVAIERLTGLILGVLAVIALVLTMVGVFSAIAYNVNRRMPEFGIRVAFGATPGDLVRLIARQGLRMTLLGVLLGLAGTAGLTRYMRTVLFETSPLNLEVLMGVVFMLLVASTLAWLFPAFRAGQADPTRLLRAE